MDANSCEVEVVGVNLVRVQGLGSWLGLWLRDVVVVDCISSCAFPLPCIPSTESSIHVLTAAATTLAPATTCPKCVANDVGTRTCCARGGGWYRTCGKKGDSKAEHTWDEGLRACRDPAPGQVQAQAMMVNRTTAIQRWNNVQQQQQNTISSPASSMKDVQGSRAVNCKDHVTVSDPTIVISLFLVLTLWYV